jgi:predicted nucleic acid-binding Zn ribbon protein
MAKNTNLIKLGDAIQQFLKQENLDIKIARHSIKNAWNEIVGSVIAKHTTNLYFNNKTLFITLNSEVIKSELSFQKENVVNKINNYCSCRLIDQIVIQ